MGSMKTVTSLLLAALLVGACVQYTSASTATPTSTPDPCAQEYLADSIKQVNDLQREFDDGSQLASNLPVASLPEVIMELQRLRRAAEDQQPPACLATLKAHQLAHMNLVIGTLIAFAGGADQTTLQDGIQRAQREHDLYALEMASLLGTPPVTTPSTP